MVEPGLYGNHRVHRCPFVSIRGLNRLFQPLLPYSENPKLHFAKDFFGAVTYLARFVTPLKGEDDEIAALPPKWWQRPGSGPCRSESRIYECASVPRHQGRESSDFVALVSSVKIEKWAFPQIFSGLSPKPPPLSPLYIVEGDVWTSPTQMNEPKNSSSTTDGH